jgi:hypothetical protein
LSWLSRGKHAEAVLADIPTGELSDVDKARLAFLRATNRLFTLADPTGPKKLIDDVSRATPAPLHDCIDAFLTVYSSSSIQEASMETGNLRYVEHLIRHSLAQQGKTRPARPVFNIIVRGTYNRLCGIPHNRIRGAGSRKGRRATL